MSKFETTVGTQAPGVHYDVGPSGGSTNEFEIKPRQQEHRFTCICEPCKKDRGDRTGKDAVYTQWHFSDPIYPKKDDVPS
jgi:hypothetical protein